MYKYMKKKVDVGRMAKGIPRKYTGGNSSRPCYKLQKITNP